MTDDMVSNRSPDQVHDDSQTLGKYQIMVRVRVRVRVQLPTGQPHELRIIINLGRQIIVNTIVYYDCIYSIVFLNFHHG